MFTWNRDEEKVGEQAIITIPATNTAPISKLSSTQLNIQNNRSQYTLIHANNSSLFRQMSFLQAEVGGFPELTITSYNVLVISFYISF